MRVLYLTTTQSHHTFWFNDFMTAVGGRYPVEVFDPAKPLADQFRGIDVVVDLGGHATNAMIDAGAEAGVRLWQVLGTGLDALDVDHVLDRQMWLANAPGPFSAPALAEHALMLMLLAAKNFQITQRNVRTRTFYGPESNEELGGRTLGLVGFGASARELAKRVRPFGMRVMAVDIAPVSQEVLDEHGVAFFGDLASLPRLLAEADYLSIHVPLNASSRNLIDRDALARMKPDAVLINVARGGIVDEAALVEALQGGRLKAAGLDAFSTEPIDPAHPLLQLPNVICTPHVAGVTRDTSRRRGQCCADNIERVAEGLPPLHQVGRSP
jgi:phosphoglycerate dehydrogenase-like enzyme